MDKTKLLELLKVHGIPLSKWGQGQAKTVEHLLAEINSGEASLKEDGAKIIRSSLGAVIQVYYQDGPDLLFLKEDRQVFVDGREKRRDLRNPTSSVGEKMRPGENPEEAAYRALREELDINERVSLTRHLTVSSKGPVLSDSFPGLWTMYKIHVFELFLPQHLYKADGYVEKQRDKTNYFAWTKIDKKVS